MRRSLYNTSKSLTRSIRPLLPYNARLLCWAWRTEAQPPTAASGKQHAICKQQHARGKLQEARHRDQEAEPGHRGRSSTQHTSSKQQAASSKLVSAFVIAAVVAVGCIVAVAVAGGDGVVTVVDVVAAGVAYCGRVCIAGTCKHA